MNKSALKKFATSIRIELKEVINSKLDYLLGLDGKLPISLKDEQNNIEKIIQRCSTNGVIDNQKKDELIEEVAYTWFNRLVALRFMDANGITESGVVSPIEDQILPEIFNLAKGGEISDKLNLDREKFYNICDGKTPSSNPDNEAYRMLFISVCNYYSTIMPFMFETIKDYTELLLPDDMLSTNSVRAKVVEALPKADCEDVEIVGWLYQFYIAEKKDEVFSNLKKNIKITPSNIPAATQLFTPHWIVKYMVENSLGRLWMLNNPDSSLKSYMQYYIDHNEDNQDFLKINSPEELTFLDPCCGSGHILTYAFDLLVKIYEEQGYNSSEIPILILQNNLYGCDIDKRAATLAQFALAMKARLYYRRFFRKNVKPNVIELQEFGSETFKGIKNFGSLLTPKDDDRFENGVFASNCNEYELQKKILTNTYHCVVTNPPYMGAKGMNKELSDFVKKRYPDSKSDLFAVFIERGLEFTKEYGYMAMITMQSWMFLSSFEKLRVKIIKNHTIKTLAHLGNMVMGIAFGTSAFILQKIKPNKDSSAVYFKIELKDLDENREIKCLK